MDLETSLPMRIPERVEQLVAAILPKTLFEHGIYKAVSKGLTTFNWRIHNVFDQILVSIGNLNCYGTFDAALQTKHYDH